MCKLIDDYAKKVGAEMAQEMAAEMVLQEKKDLAIGMLKEKEFSKEKISIILRLPLGYIEEVERELIEEA